MADPNDSPMAERRQHTPTANNRQRRNNTRNRKSNQVDDTISDGASINPAVSPRPKRAQQKQRASGVPSSAASDFDDMGRASGQAQRPASMNASQARATPAKERAYAGPTFQASPAASALPLPKCFSRSLPNNAAPASLQARLAGEKTPEDPGSSPESDAVTLAAARESQQSPLDFFFQADRAEKERIRSGSGSLSPQSARRPPPPVSMPRNSSQQSDQGVFLQELDAQDHYLPSPRAAPPMHRPALAQRAHSHSSRPNNSEDERQAKSQSLKDMLFNSVSTPPSSQGQNYTGSRTPDGAFGSPSPLQRLPSGPSTPQRSAEATANYSLHYGNRNLSPLFKAARSDTPPRPSSLRQELAGNAPPMDTNAYARSYLNEQIRNAPPVQMPQLSFGDQPHQLRDANGNQGPVPIPVQSVNVHHGVPTSDSPDSGRPDLRGMEDNLRRMLKIA